MKKQQIILIEYDEPEDCDNPMRENLWPIDIHSLIYTHDNDLGGSMSYLEVRTIADVDAHSRFDEIADMIKESVDDD